MKTFSTSFKEKLRKLDITVMVCVTILTCISLLVLFGGHGTFGMGKFAMQFAMAALGFLLMVLISMLDYQDVIDKMYVIFFFISVGALAITLLIGTGNGNKSWIRFDKLGIPFGIQPSEFVKITFIATFTKHLDRVKKEINRPKNVFALLVHAGLIIGLVLLSKDLGVALVYMGITAFMLFSAGLSLWYFFIVIVAVVVVFPYVWPLLEEYQQKRILVGFDPMLDPLDKGYQPLLSRSAISSGGFWGQGIFGGEVYEELPAAHTDFVFAVIGEKLGFFGLAVVIVTMCVLVVRIIVIARKSRKDTGSYVCMGIAAALIIQTTENIGMCMAMLPVVGITLPFLSYGGSSTLALYMMMGVVQSVQSHRVKYFFERETT